MIREFSVALIMLTFFSSCETTLLLDAETTEKIVYSFNDSSVPPEYHRSFEITVSKTNVFIIVDAYGDTLATDSRTISEKEFQDFITEINSAKLTKSTPKNDLSCTGSTSESLKIFTDELLLNTYLDHCQVDEFPAKSGDVRSVIDQMKAFFPNLNELLQ